jgi:predicted  nucleic acid-binding Zn-ribbon protein
MMGDLDTRVDNCAKQIDVLKAKRLSQADKIEGELLNRYTRIKGSQGGRKAALVQLNEDKCGFCHLKLTVQEINQAKTHVVMTSCSNCGSLIYR